MIFQINRKKALSGVLAGCLCLTPLCSTGVPVYASSKDEISVTVNGDAISFDAAPEIKNDRTFVPMRGIFEALDADVSWDNSRREAVATLGNDEVILKVGSTIGIHNTTVDELDAAPYIKDDRTMVPVRYLSESLGYDVSWDNETATVNISSATKSDDDGQTDETDGNTDTKKPHKDENGNEIVTDGSYKYTILTYHDLNAPEESITGNKTALTYNAVVKRFLDVDTGLNQAKLSNEQAETTLDEFHKLHTSYDMSDLETQALEALRLANNWTAKNYVVTAEQEAYSIVTEMDSISLQIAEISNQEAKLDYAKEQLEIATLKYNAGTISAADLKSAKKDVEAAQLALDSLKVELEGMYISLYGSLKYDQTDYLEPQFTVEYEPVGTVDLEEKYSKDLNNDPYIWYVEHAEDNAELNVKTYVYNYSEKSKALTVMDLTQARMNTNATKQNLKTAEYTRYNQILQLENSIGSLDNSLNELRDSINTLRTQYEAGIVSKVQMEAVLQNLSDLKFNRLKLVLTHKQAVDTFKTMYLNPTYMSTGSAR